MYTGIYNSLDTNDFRSKKMDKATDQSIIEYITLIKKSFDNIESAYLFGSYVNGRMNEDSDIDLAIVFKRLDDSERFDIQVKLMILASRIDARIEPHPISSDDFQKGNPFAAEIRKTGVEVEMA